MSGFFKKIVKRFKTTFELEDDSYSESSDSISEFGYSETESIDRSALNSSYEDTIDEDLQQVYEDVIALNKVDYSDYWWHYTGEDEHETAVFEEVDYNQIYVELTKRIDEGQFPVIEIPENALKAIEILNNPEFDFAEVSFLINKSPAMAGEFLNIVNSSIYSRGVKIRDLRVALPRIGRENVKAMLYLYSTKMSIADCPVFNEMAVKIVDHSYATAITASYLSQRYFPDPDTAFLAGLLHDIGKLGIIKAISEDYGNIDALPADLCEQHFGGTFEDLHGKVGTFLAERWNIDSLIIDAIEHHHDFFEFGFDYDEQESYMLSALINLCDTMCRILGHGTPVNAVDVFELVATSELNIERDSSSIDFLEEIPGILNNKA